MGMTAKGSNTLRYPSCINESAQMQAALGLGVWDPGTTPMYAPRMHCTHTVSTKPPERPRSGKTNDVRDAIGWHVDNLYWCMPVM